MKPWLRGSILSLLLVWLSVHPTVAAPTGSGQQAVQIAQRQLGVPCQDVALPGYHVWGRRTNGCAELVVAVLAGAGSYHPTAGDAWVATFEKALQSQGWKAIARTEARPGDVAIFHDANGVDQHTEIVASDGATLLIGNNGKAQETVSYDSGDWGSPTFYAPERTDPHLLQARLQQAQAQAQALEAEVAQVEADGSRLQGQASKVQEWYREGAISQREAQTIERQAQEQRQRAESLRSSLADARAQVADSAAACGSVPVVLAATVPPASDAAYWRNLYAQGAIPRAMLEQHVK